MNDNTLELAENKLLLLHIIKSIKYPISNTQLTDIVLENSFKKDSTSNKSYLYYFCF